MPTALKKPKAKAPKKTVEKAADSIFAKIKEKTGLTDAKVDQFQKDWLAMPKTRKKYEHWQDAPEVVGEELLGMTNDILEFIQGQEGGNSLVFSKLKAEAHSLVEEIKKDPVGFAKAKWDAAEGWAKGWAERIAEEAKAFQAASQKLKEKKPVHKKS